MSPGWLDMAAALRARGLLDPVEERRATDLAREPQAPDHERPKVVSALLGMAGWVAGLLVVLVIGLLSRGSISWRLGLLLLAAAWGLFRIGRGNVLLGQFGLALSIAGQLAFLASMAPDVGARLMAITLAMQLALAVLMPSRLHRWMSSFFAGLAWAGLVGSLVNLETGLQLTGRLASGSVVTVLGWTLAVVPLAMLLLRLIRSEAGWIAAGRQALARPATTGLALALAWAPFALLPFIGLTFARGTWGETWPAPLLALVSAFAGMAAGFALRERSIVGASTVAVLADLARAWFAVDLPLFTSAAVLATVGVAALAGARALRPRSGST